MIKRILVGVLAVVLIAGALVLYFPKQDMVEAAEIPSIPEILVDPSGSPNTFYFVAMFYYDIWQNNNGSWSPAAPGSDVSGVTFPYAFDMPGRKITSVTVNAFNTNFVNQNRSKWETVFRESRYRSYEWRDYEQMTSLQHGAQIQNMQGIGTSSVSFNLRLTSPSRLNAPSPERFNAPGGNPGQRHYFPMLLTIEVEPQLIVKHFTTAGESLSHIFTDTVEEMRNGTRYQKVPPAHVDYNYVGHKKSTTGSTPTGEIISGPPPAFTYDNTFNTYTLFLYYGKKSGPDETRGDFTINPNPVYYGESFTFTPINLYTSTGLDFVKLMWRIINPDDPNDYVEYVVDGTNSYTVTPNHYPAFFKDEKREYNVEMYCLLGDLSAMPDKNLKTHDLAWHFLTEVDM